MSKELYTKQYFLNCKLTQLSRAKKLSVFREIMRLKPERVLDVGCGLGALVKWLREKGVEAYGVDFAQTIKDDFGLKEDYFVIADAKKLPFEDNHFDVVVSTDFFEHLPEEEIDIVLGEMKRVGGKILAKIAYEAPLNLRQTKLHLTNKPKSWWKKKLKGVTLI